MLKFILDSIGCLRYFKLREVGHNVGKDAGGHIGVAFVIRNIKWQRK
jgi:hypothetical protein